MSGWCPSSAASPPLSSIRFFHPFFRPLFFHPLFSIRFFIRFLHPLFSSTFFTAFFLRFFHPLLFIRFVSSVFQPFWACAVPSLKLLLSGRGGPGGHASRECAARLFNPTMPPASAQVAGGSPLYRWRSSDEMEHVPIRSMAATPQAFLRRRMARTCRKKFLPLFWWGLGRFAGAPMTAGGTEPCV